MIGRSGLDRQQVADRPGNLPTNMNPSGIPVVDGFLVAHRPWPGGHENEVSSSPAIIFQAVPELPHSASGFS